MCQALNDILRARSPATGASCLLVCLARAPLLLCVIINSVFMAA